MAVTAMAHERAQALSPPRNHLLLCNYDRSKLTHVMCRQSCDRGGGVADTGRPHGLIPLLDDRREQYAEMDLSQGISHRTTVI